MTPSARRRANTPAAVAALLAALVLAVCGGDAGRSLPEVRLEPALGGRTFERPVELGAYPGGRLFIAQQDGLVLLSDATGADLGVLLDLRDRVGLDPGEGLLSVALAPDFQRSGRLWAYYFADGPPTGDFGPEITGRSVLARYQVVGDSAVGGSAVTDFADTASELLVLEIPQPGFNQNGGAIRFGPDGMLYLSVGDGSASFDPFDNGQDRSTLLGTVLRIDVREASAAEPYRVPADNPFVDDETARGELWAYGLRNPWRMAFDAETGALWLGDVGPSTREEVNRIERGGNYGWDLFEGTSCLAARPDCDDRGLTPPVAEYEHAAGRCAVIGGEVYRGAAIPELQGRYLYADFCSGELWAIGDSGAAPVLLTRGPASIVSFGADEARELYLLSHSGEVLRLVPQ